MQQRLERQAVNEGLFRDVNERIAALDKLADRGWVVGDERYEFICECGATGGCDGRLSMSLAEYETVRAQDDRFALVPGHETDGLERVVAQTDRFVVVDKVAAAEPLVADDPRGAPST